MPPVKPNLEKLGIDLPDGAIGLNLSPLMARSVCDGNLRAWLSRCIDIVTAICDALEGPVILIPHVTSAEILEDDFRLLVEIKNAVPKSHQQKLLLIPPHLSAAETKWVISRCRAFAGARTHATIAAYSSCVPTLSFAYSLKAKGLNRDIFGNQDYCINGDKLTASLVTERLIALLLNADAIRIHLRSQVENIRTQSYRAGALLKQVIDKEIIPMGNA
jgi:polysaccharide pyruvyl transferase WcaK-like protein